MNEVPNPGSEAAIAQGCTCPVIDNHYGAGVPMHNGPMFWYTENCPVHQKPLDYGLPNDIPKNASGTTS